MKKINASSLYGVQGIHVNKVNEVSDTSEYIAPFDIAGDLLSMLTNAAARDEDNILINQLKFAADPDIISHSTSEFIKRRKNMIRRNRRLIRRASKRFGVNIFSIEIQKYELATVIIYRTSLINVHHTDVIEGKNHDVIKEKNEWK